MDGLIVDPKNDFNESYSKIRPKSIIENVVLVSNDYKKDTIFGDFSHYMTGGVENIHSLVWNPIEYKCSTLNKILKKHNVNEVHFFSLDVEGYEINVLNGIDFSDVFFHIIVVENHGKWDKDGSLIYDDFDFLNYFGFYRKHKINQHEFYLNIKSEYYDSFTI